MPMGSHSVTCHQTQVNAPRLTPAMIYLPRRDGRLSWPVDLIASRPGVESAAFRSRVRHRTAAPPRQPMQTKRERNYKRRWAIRRDAGWVDVKRRQVLYRGTHVLPVAEAAKYIIALVRQLINESSVGSAYRDRAIPCNGTARSCSSIVGLSCTFFDGCNRTIRTPGREWWRHDMTENTGDVF